ncbi:MAG: FAD:protein FMN transferase [Planctomycetaceae bacterium]|jgi:thiamine biosynthesis lipoprotein|nr:FAD:protein FMN transferase [Planctomycetaceae bacterium]
MSKESQKQMADKQSANENAYPLYMKVIIVVIFVALAYYGVRNHFFVSKPYSTVGETMGTIPYCVQVFSNTSRGWEKTSDEIKKELTRIDYLMSTYKKDSEVTKFNENFSTDWIEVSGELVKLVKLSKEVSEIVDKKFDITIAPLVDLWGFGPHKHTLTNLPSPADIALMQSKSGLDKLEFQENPPALKKTVEELQIDLSGIAKGYAVDRVAAVLEKHGYVNYLIEVGGETRTRGYKTDRQTHEMHSWLIGIEVPFPRVQFQMLQVFAPVNLKDHAMATSGDSQNFTEIAGQHYTHIIDPISGEAKKTSLSNINGNEEIGSVSVIASNCAQADALATGFFLLETERGIEIANQHKIPVIYVLRTGNQDEPLRIVKSDAVCEERPLIKKTWWESVTSWFGGSEDERPQPQILTVN